MLDFGDYLTVHSGSLSVASIPPVSNLFFQLGMTNEGSRNLAVAVNLNLHSNHGSHLTVEYSCCHICLLFCPVIPSLLQF